MDHIKFLYLSPHEWGNIGRRKVRLAHEFARQADVASVLYVEPAVETSLLDLARGRFQPSHLGVERRRHRDALLGRPRRVEERVWTYTGSAKTLPLTRFEPVRRLGALQELNKRLYWSGMRRVVQSLPGDRLVVWASHPLYVEAFDAFPNRALAVYDWTDDWSQFEVLPVADREELIRMNDETIRRADVVFAVSRNLFERARRLNPNTYRAPNATDWHLLQRTAIPHPIIGYMGQIGDRVDFELLREVALARPDWSLVLVGPVWENKRAVAEALGALPNVYFLGWRPYTELPSFMRGFDVCAIPHTCDRLTASMDPIKLYDYLTSGKPIVTTRVAGIDRFLDVLYIADGPAEFVACTATALAEADPERVAKRKEYARANTWQRRAAELYQIVRAQVESRGR